MKTLAIKRFKKLDSASKILGFSAEFPSRFKIKTIRVISGRILEIEFGSVIVRKVKYTEHYLNDIGFPNYKGTYPNDCNGVPFSQYKGQSGTQYWNGSTKTPKAYLSTWIVENGGKNSYAYSVYANKGIKIKTMANWELNFK